jgi:two-component sensor histidine kinase
MSLRNRLSILVGLALLPPIGLLAFDTVETRSRERRQLHDQALYQAQLVAGQLEVIIQGSQRLSWALANQTRIRTDLERCRLLMRDVVNNVPLYRAGIVTDHTGKVVCSWPKADDVDLGDRDYVVNAMRQNELVVGTLILRGRVTGAAALPLARRYLAAEGSSEPGGVLILGLDLDLLSRGFQERYNWSNRYLSVLDRDGTIIIRVPGENAVGRKVSAEALARATGKSGTFEGSDAFGRPSIIGYAKLESLLISVGYDADSVLATLNESTWRNALLMALVALLALTGAWIAGERLVRRPVKRMVKAARRYETGDRSVRFPEVKSGTELGQLARALNRMADANEKLLSQREILMRELQHRVMNSLQLLASFLQLQARNADAATREQLAVARERIISMSTIFRYLYRADLGSTVEFGSFLEAFCNDTARAYLGGASPQLELAVDRRDVPLEQALSLALMTHELITNAIKHAFPPGAPGRIRIAFKAHPDGSSELVVSDNGKGMPAGFDPGRSKSLGMVLVQRLTQSLNGTLRIRSGAEGTEISIALPPPPAKNG